MTLNSRNRLMKFFSLYSLVQLLAFAVMFIYAAIEGDSLNLPYAEINLPPESFGDAVRTMFSTYSYAALASIAVLAIYTPCVCYIVSYVFEKTQSPEILYFLGFLTGCLTESLRFCIPLFNLWNGYSTGLILLGKTIFAGRLLSMLSFLFSALFSTDDRIQDADRNLVISIAVSIFLAYTTAIDTRTVHPSIMVNTAFQTPFTIMRIALAVISIIAFILNGKRKTAVPYILLISGYLMLTQTDSMGFAVLGAVLLTAGTKFYFQTLHNYYLWK